MLDVMLETKDEKEMRPKMIVKTVKIRSAVLVAMTSIVAGVNWHSAQCSDVKY